MDPVGGPLLLLALAIAGNAVAWFFKTPKESAGEMMVRVRELEQKHHALDNDYTGFQQLILGEIRNLADAVNRLASAVGHAGVTITGEHPIAKPRGRG